MIDINAIEALIDSKAIVGVEDRFGRPRLILKESGTDAKLKKVFVGGIPRDSVLIKLDGAKPLNALLAKDFGLRCRCDYVLLTERNGRKILVFCELKSERFSHPEVSAQFKGGKCLVRYFESLLQEFHGRRGVLPASEDWYYVLFYKDSTRKRTTKNQNVRGGRSEIKFCKYPNPSLVDLRDIVG